MRSACLGRGRRITHPCFEEKLSILLFAVFDDWVECRVVFGLRR